MYIYIHNRVISNHKHVSTEYIFQLTYFVYIYVYKLLCHLQKCINIYIYMYNIYINIETFISKRITFRFPPNLQRLNKITKSVKSVHVKPN